MVVVSLFTQLMRTCVCW